MSEIEKPIFEQLADKYVALEAANERLRAALQRIELLDSADMIGSIEAAGAIARAALDVAREEPRAVESRREP